MKTLRKILVALLIIIAIPLVVALFVKKDYAVSRDVVIKQPKRVVFDYIRYLKNQDNYSKWASMDPAMKKTYRGTDGTVGFVSRWESNHKDVGTGEQEIKKITDGERIDYELRFYKPFEATEPAYMTVADAGEGQTKVTWAFSGHMNYPMNLMMLFMNMEEMIGKDLESGLAKLKSVLESQTTTADGSKAFLENYYMQTTANLEKAVSGLSAAQMSFSPGEGKWSVAQCLEHIIATEKKMFADIKKDMDKPAQPERKAEIKSTDADIIKMITDRSAKYKAPKELQPAGNYASTAEALSAFMATRQAIAVYIQNASLENLRNHISDYPTGKADGYQNFLFLAAHTARHTMQIEKVKADPAFPKQ